MLTVSELAKKKLAEFAEKSEGEELILRVAIIGRTQQGFQYDLQLVPNDQVQDDDTTIEVEGWTIAIAAKSVSYMEGATLDFKETLMGGGFHFENPNPLWNDDLAKRVDEVIQQQVNPAVASHGGNVSLIDVKEGEAIITFGGGCQGCAAVDITLKQGVETMIKDNVPEIETVTDATDHAAGANPFY